MKKKIAILAGLVLIMNLIPTLIFGSQSQNININGKSLELGNWIINQEGTTYIPFQIISNLLEAESSFNEKDQSVTLSKDNMKIWLQTWNKTAIINGIKLEAPAQPQMIYNTLFVPLKFVFETLGATVGWDQSTNAITIVSNQITYKGQSVKELLEEPLQEGFVQIKISAAGDCILGFDERFSTANRFDSVFKEKNKDYGYFFKNVKPIFETDDLTIINLENPLTTATKKLDKEFAFKGPPEYTRILTEGSVEVVNLANNHTYDYLEQGMKDTTTNLKKANISYFGEGHKSIIEVKGIKVGNLGYKGWNNSKWVKDNIKKDIDGMKKAADLVIVTFHWGEERANYPNSIQKDLGHFAIDNGADLVLGHHPHVMQGIEQYKDKYIVYSLGNFSFGGNRNPSDKDTFIFQQSFTFDNTKQLVSNRTNVIPCTISSVSYRNDYCPTPQTGQAAQRIMNRLKKYSSVFLKPGLV